MARFNGILHLSGKIGELSFYKRNGKWVVRQSYGPSAQRIATGENYQRTRENNSEFGLCSTYAARFRRAIKPLTHGIADSNFVNRSNSAFMALRELDGLNIRGQRTPIEGLKNPASRPILQNLQLVNGSTLASILHAQTLLQTSLFTLTFQHSGTGPWLVFPPEATAAQIDFMAFSIDLLADHSECSRNSIVCMPNSALPLPMSVAAPTLTGQVIIFGLRITFVQDINGHAYPLKNKAHHYAGFL